MRVIGAQMHAPGKYHNGKRCQGRKDPCIAI